MKQIKSILLAVFLVATSTSFCAADTTAVFHSPRAVVKATYGTEPFCQLMGEVYEYIEDLSAKGTPLIQLQPYAAYAYRERLSGEDVSVASGSFIADKRNKMVSASKFFQNCMNVKGY